MKLKFLIPLLCVAGSLSAEPVPFLTHAGHYAIDWSPTRQTLEISSPSIEASYDVTGCVFGRRQSGIFPLHIQGLEAPHIVQHCETESGDRLSIYAPQTDPRHPVFEIYATRVEYRLGPDRLSITARDAPRARHIDWSAEGARQASPVDIPELRRLPDPLIARRQGLALLDRQLRSADGRRQLTGVHSDWPGWTRLLRGGWTTERQADGRQTATLPADRTNWPDDLEQAQHLYGDRSGALMRTAPHNSAPALRPIQRVILTPGPDLSGGEALRASGWLHVCTTSVECGFVRADDVRAPEGAWARFSRSGPGEPWTLEHLATE
ncbi:MAG: hypothetical protein AAGH74_06255 [Pseudomonadota bacterium]